jgi:hypothetical protein
MAAYSFLDRLLHRLALQSLSTAELSFDIDQRMVDTDPNDITGARHVFVSGLARAGTTVLMRQFHATGAYRSLTYRDMPFVLAPNLWQKLSGASQGAGVAVERAHGDGILVDAESPESLDEVFWRVFAGDDYISKTHLIPHSPDAELVQKYVGYINAILNAQGERKPLYLSKNNNNILRLKAIRQAFPQALILIPFRAPLSHAGSLLRQHQHFTKVHAEDPFSQSYMTWLAHHEFGADHRPFRFDEAAQGQASPHSKDSLDYWLEIWCVTYEWLERTAPDDAIFVCYEDLCSDTTVWGRLADLAGLSTESAQTETFKLGRSPTDTKADPALADRASSLYTRLANKAREALH